MRSFSMSRVAVSWVRIFVFAVSAGPAVQLAQAQDLNKPAGFPARSMSIIVCFPPGGGTDQMARAIAGPAEKVLGVPVSVVNKPGAGGLGCLPDFYSAPPDGYVLLQHTDNLVTAYASKKTDMNPAERLAPVLIANVVPSQIYINPKDERFLTNGKPDWDKVVAYAKSKPGQLTVSNYGSPDNLEGVSYSLIERHFGIKSRVISFDKASERYGAVVGRQVDILFEQPSDVRALLEANELTPVLSVSKARLRVFPDTPATGADYGATWDAPVKWRALFAHPDTPKPILDYLRRAFRAAYLEQSHQDYLKKQGMDTVESYRSGPDTQDLIAKEIGVYSQIYRELGMPSR